MLPPAIRFPTVPRTVEKQFAQDLLLYPHVRESLEQLLNGKEINPYEDTSTSVVRSKREFASLQQLLRISLTTPLARRICVTGRSESEAAAIREL